jgi:hypothetical protein
MRYALCALSFFPHSAFPLPTSVLPPSHLRIFLPMRYALCPMPVLSAFSPSHPLTFSPSVLPAMRYALCPMPVLSAFSPSHPLTFCPSRYALCPLRFALCPMPLLPISIASVLKSKYNLDPYIDMLKSELIPCWRVEIQVCLQHGLTSSRFMVPG